MKQLNQAIEVIRVFKNLETGKLEPRPKVINISEARVNATLSNGKKIMEPAWCPECKERVSLHINAIPVHYEHFNNNGAPCSFKV